MTSTDDVQEMQAALGRLRESVLFYLKLDFALFAAFAAVATIFKLTPEAILQHSDFVIDTLLMLVWLAGGGLTLEFVITWTRNFQWARDKFRLGTIQIGYFILIVGHIIVLVAYLMAARILMS
ncbi:MAG: hypothetical protein IIA10_04425 [Proteobacteria bacterium]|nr:hypothetical protein [Pseudomonadota bacterium]